MTLWSQFRVGAVICNMHNQVWCFTFVPVRRQGQTGSVQSHFDQEVRISLQGTIAPLTHVLGLRRVNVANMYRVRWKRKACPGLQSKKSLFLSGCSGSTQVCRQRTVCSRAQREGQLVTKAVPTSRFLFPSNHPPFPDFSTSSSSVAHGEWHPHPLLLLPRPVVIYLEMT